MNQGYLRQPFGQVEPSSPINMGNTDRIVFGVLGSVMLGAAIFGRKPQALLAAIPGVFLAYQGATGMSPLYRMLGINTAVETDPRRVAVPHQQGIRVEKTVTIHRPAIEIYRFWRQLENLPRIFSHLESVTVMDERRSHWVAKAPAGMKVEWDATIITDIPGEVIGWRSLENAQVPNAGSVRFRPAPGAMGTEVQVDMEYTPPAGPIGAAIAALFGDEPNQILDADLRRFKQMMEAGEVSTTNGPSAVGRV